jgi:2-amino-4-hydroxy-6-hydroxymethyldihydropteridine diphosphokinase
VATCYLGLGSNVGDRVGAVLKAIELIAAGEGTEVRRLSALYLTRPWGHEDQADFVNAVAEVETRLEPVELLARAKDIERQMGRVERFRWGPREIDIDILLYGDEVLEVDGLSVPHPGIEERAFVLVPLLELDPGLVHPETGRRLSESLRRLESLGEVSWEKLTT